VDVRNEWSFQESFARASYAFLFAISLLCIAISIFARWGSSQDVTMCVGITIGLAIGCPLAVLMDWLGKSN